MEKIYRCLSDDLKQRLEKSTFFVSKWLVSEVAERYQISSEAIEKMCHHFDLPIVLHSEGNKSLSGRKVMALTHHLYYDHHPLRNSRFSKR